MFVNSFPSEAFVRSRVRHEIPNEQIGRGSRHVDESARIVKEIFSWISWMILGAEKVGAEKVQVLYIVYQTITK